MQTGRLTCLEAMAAHRSTCLRVTAAQDTSGEPNANDAALDAEAGHGCDAGNILHDSRCIPVELFVSSVRGSDEDRDDGRSGSSLYPFKTFSNAMRVVERSRPSVLAEHSFTLHAATRACAAGREHDTRTTARTRFMRLQRVANSE